MTPHTPIDQILLERCSAGDQDAWRTVVKRYERLVYAIPLREGLSKEQAANVAQETFTTLFTKLDAIRDPARLPSWLMTVARRESWRRRNNAMLLVSEVDEIAADDDFVEQYSESAAIYSAVQSLGNPCRELIFGLFLDPAEPEYAALAEGLGRPVGSIGPLRGRCLTRLRVILEEEHVHV